MLFFNRRKSYIKCSECDLSVSKNHLKCHFEGATGDICDNTCQNQTEGDNSPNSSLYYYCASKVQPTFSHECTQCSMVRKLINTVI